MESMLQQKNFAPLKKSLSVLEILSGNFKCCYLALRITGVRMWHLQASWLEMNGDCLRNPIWIVPHGLGFVK